MVNFDKYAEAKVIQVKENGEFEVEYTDARQAVLTEAFGELSTHRQVS